jgi:hypothetical protein
MNDSRTLYQGVVVLDFNFGSAKQSRRCLKERES